MIEFINSSFIYIGLPTMVLVAILWVWSEKRRTRTLKSIISDEMAPKLLSSACGIRRSWRNILFTAAWLILAFCLLRPYSGVDIEERKQQSRDILVVFDVSNSMNVIDCYGESRMDYGRNLIRKLSTGLPSDRFGLMSFAGLAFVEIPLTTDTVSYEIALESLSKNKIPLGGTNIQIALDQALKEFKEGAEHKAMILISDGEEIGGDYHEAAKELKEKNVKLITVLTGDTRKAGTVRNTNDVPLRDRAGTVLTSKADSSLLKELAKETGGIFIDFDPNGNSFQQLNALKKEISTMTSLQGEDEIVRKPREIFQPFLLAAIILLLIRMFLGERKKSFNSIAVILALFFSMPVLKAQQQPGPPALNEKDKNALMSLKNEEAGLVKDANSENLEDKFRAMAWYNLATNLAKQHFLQPVEPKKKAPQDDKNKVTPDPDKEEEGSLAKAEAAFDKAVSLAGNQKGITASALHNKGTLFQKEAQKILLQDPEKAENLLNEANQLYRNALILNPGDEQIRKNLERSFIDISNAKIAKEIHKLRAEARDKAGKSLFSFRSIKSVPVRSPEKVKEILANSAAVKSKCLTIKDKLSAIDKEAAKQLFDQVLAHVQQADAKINNLSKEASEETEKHLAEAYKLLGGNPDQEENQNQNQDENSENEKKDDQQEKQNKNDQQENKNSKNDSKSDQKQDPNDQKQQSENKPEKDKDGKENEKQEMDPKNDGFFDKNKDPQPPMSNEEKERRAKLQEAEALLRKLSDTEKEVREHIRDRQAERIRQEMRRQGISIPPEADK